jgi:Short C-terminal domain
MTPASEGVPPAPVVMTAEIWPGIPNVLVDAERYSIGWQGWPDDEGGPGYVTVRRSRMGGLKVVERYPLTGEGWARAWHAFAELDPATAARVVPVLARRREAETGYVERRQLDARSLGYLPEVIFVGGYLADGQLTAGNVYELRFLEDEVAVYRRGSLIPVAEFPYAGIQAVEVAGPGRVRKWTPAQQAMLAAAFGVTGGLVAYGTTRIKTFVRIQAAASELFFLHTTLLPEDLRIALSRGLGAVREAVPPAAGADAGGLMPPQASLVDELSRLAALLNDGLLTREEFDQLKAQLIARQ